MEREEEEQQDEKEVNVRGETTTSDANKKEKNTRGQKRVRFEPLPAAVAAPKRKRVDAAEGGSGGDDSCGGNEVGADNEDVTEEEEQLVPKHVKLWVTFESPKILTTFIRGLAVLKQVDLLLVHPALSFHKETVHSINSDEMLPSLRSKDFSGVVIREQNGSLLINSKVAARVRWRATTSCDDITHSDTMFTINVDEFADCVGTFQNGCALILFRHSCGSKLVMKSVPDDAREGSWETSMCGLLDSDPQNAENSKPLVIRDIEYIRTLKMPIQEFRKLHNDAKKCKSTHLDVKIYDDRGVFGSECEVNYPVFTVLSSSSRLMHRKIIRSAVRHGDDSITVESVQDIVRNSGGAAGGLQLSNFNRLKLIYSHLFRFEYIGKFIEALGTGANIVKVKFSTPGALVFVSNIDETLFLMYIIVPVQHSEGEGDLTRRGYDGFPDLTNPFED
jgi:hypothetical protein